MISRALLLGLVLVASQAFGQAFPNRPLRLVVPFPPGGPTDQVSRLLSQKLGETLGQPIVVDNRPGGGAQIAATALLQSPADGYTILIGDIGALAINKSLYQNLSYDPQRDFRAVTNVMTAPMVLIVPAKSSANSVAELLDLAKRNGRLSYASQGIGTGGHLLGEMFQKASGATLIHVPYKGGGPAMQDLIAGQVDLLFDAMGAAVPQARGGKAKILAVGDAKRSPRTPEVPTMAEAGFPDVQMVVWFGMVAHAKTPDAIIRRLNSEIVSALNSPDVSKRLSDQGFDPAPSTPEAFDALMREESVKWAAVVKASGARVD
ncbi:MAG TPA: tripartite tricarboxylate transporter substrate binding protein [Burkholderiales bacterium]|nr:tripartite tricarboxylate transporter substrate binding protein [Burkholderiales bacterium]